MNVAKPWPFGETVVRAELVGVTYRGVGAVTRAKVRLVLQSTRISSVDCGSNCTGFGAVSIANTQDITWLSADLGEGQHEHTSHGKSGAFSRANHQLRPAQLSLPLRRF